MSYIQNYIDELNKQKRKVLSIFLTAGFPDKNNFVGLAKNILDAGADIIELGIPFSDPLADGPVIQASSNAALENNVNLKNVFTYAENICSYSNKPVVMMGYANPIRKYGIKNFLSDAVNAGAKGLIVPDVPLEEYDFFFAEQNENLDVILLTTPTSPDDRIRMIDSKSEGFVYCVSVTGTTGVKNNFSGNTIDNLRRTYSLIKKNKMLIGFGISKPEDIKNFSPFCDGVIVGSRIIKSLLNGDKLADTLKIVSEISSACG
ncbi:MAG: tryptophan synthase subunit alpha [Bacteroidota bacterium]